MIETIIGNFNLNRIMWIIKRRLLLMIIFGAIGGIGVGYFALQTSYELYNARISMYVYGDENYIDNDTVNVSSAELRKAKDLVPSYMLILKSKTVLDKVTKKIEAPYTTEAISGMINAGSVEETAVFYVNVLNSDPYIAMEVANAIAEIAPAEIARVVKSGGVEVIDYATLPTEPYIKTDIVKYVVIGVMAGFGISLLIFLLVGLLDGTIRKKNELIEVFNIPILGEVPIIYDPSKKVKANKVLDAESPFMFKESYNSIRSNIMFTGNGDICPVFVVTSADKGDGKSINCINIAVSFALLGKRTLIIDADLRNPSLHRRFSREENTEGLSLYLAGLINEVNILKTSTENLSILCAGVVPPNPSDLIASVQFEQLILALRERFDYILIDTAPLGLVSDALDLSQSITGYILVVRSGVSKIEQQKQMVRQLEGVEAQISGFIYNAINPKSSDSKFKYYNISYDSANLRNIQKV